MFTTGRLIFAGCFILVFTTLIVYSYWKDRKRHQKQYKGAPLTIFIALILFISVLFAMKKWLH